MLLDKTSHAEAVYNVAKLFTLAGATVLNQDEINHNKQMADMAKPINELIAEYETIESEVVPLNENVNELTKDVANVVTEIVDNLTMDNSVTFEDVSIKSNLSDMYITYLPKDLTLETVEAVRNYDRDFNAGVLLGIGDSVYNSMKNNDGVFSSINTSFKLPFNETLETQISIDEDQKEYVFDQSRYFNDNPQILSITDNLTSLFLKAVCGELNND